MAHASSLRNLSSIARSSGRTGWQREKRKALGVTGGCPMRPWRRGPAPFGPLRPHCLAPLRRGAGPGSGESAVNA
eukprot:3525841-Pyramimonas_sp.AAC.1